MALLLHLSHAFAMICSKSQREPLTCLKAGALVLHELWEGPDGNDWTFCLAGPGGDAARRLLPSGARLIWTVVANSHFDAMTEYYTYMGWGVYTTEFPADYIPYQLISVQQPTPD
jgi:hypothetical protein